MYKKSLVIIISVIVISLTIYGLASKEKEEEPITINSHPSYIRLSIDELIRESDLIVIGNVNNVLPSRWNTPNGKRPEGNPAQAITPDMVIFTDMNFRITRFIKGEAKQGIARIRTLGGVVNDDRMIADDSIPKTDKTYLLFLDLDTLGSTAQIDPGHYWITGGGFQGLYEIVDDRAISTMDEWALEDLISYIQKALQNSQ
jgi:hypothetical protein